MTHSDFINKFRDKYGEKYQVLNFFENMRSKMVIREVETGKTCIR